MLALANVIWGARCGKSARRVLLGETTSSGHAYSVRRRRESASWREAPHRLPPSRLVSTILTDAPFAAYSDARLLGRPFHRAVFINSIVPLGQLGRRQILPVCLCNNALRFAGGIDNGRVATSGEHLVADRYPVRLVQVHAAAIRVENPMTLGDIESGDCHDIRTENGSETLLGRMRGLGGKLIPVVVLKRSRRTIFPFDFLGSLEIGIT